jgi:hypothetical protein
MIQIFSKDSLFSLIPRRWATNLGGGSTTNGRDSAGKRLGIKLGNGKLPFLSLRCLIFQKEPQSKLAKLSLDSVVLIIIPVKM